jgi:hypothetical protein
MRALIRIMRGNISHFQSNRRRAPRVVSYDQKFARWREDRRRGLVAGSAERDPVEDLAALEVPEVDGLSPESA